MNEDEAYEYAEEQVRMLIDRGYLDEILFDEKVEQLVRNILDEPT